MKQSELIIYLKESDVPLTHNRKQLVRYFLRGKSIPTYENKECTKLQCDGKGNDNGSMAYRSVTDLLAIVRSRFPKTSLEGLLKIIHSFIHEDKAVVMVWCNMINKVTLKYYNNPSADYITKISRREYYDNKGVDGYSLRDYEEIMKQFNN